MKEISVKDLGRTCLLVRVAHRATQQVLILRMEDNGEIRTKAVKQREGGFPFRSGQERFSVCQDDKGLFLLPLNPRVFLKEFIMLPNEVQANGG